MNTCMSQLRMTDVFQHDVLVMPVAVATWPETTADKQCANMYVLSLHCNDFATV